MRETTAPFPAARLLLAVGVGLAVGLTLLPGAADGRLAARNVRLRMEGYVGAPPPGRREQADLTLRVDKTDYRFQVTNATVLSGSALAADVFSRVEPYKPNFILRGPKELLAKLPAAAPGTRLVIIGQWIVGVRDFMVASIDPGSAAP